MWRSIVLYGRNVASYKFALAKSLLELSSQPDDLVTLEALAEPFARHVSEHLKTADKQATSATSRFLDACRKFNAGEIDPDTLRASTVQLGFNNVIDAFHIVNRDEVGVRFFVDERKTSNAIRITDDLRRLAAGFQASSLPSEVESRWRLVETAWELNMPRQALTVEYDPDSKLLLPDTRRFQRPAITASRDALNGYQKGHCFYCGAEISVKAGHDQLGDVDHFFPHSLEPTGIAQPIDGVWNLVLACKTCNRGSGGKFDRIPAFRFLERLHKRNEYLIGSHHPLRDTLIEQTGNTEPKRVTFLNRAFVEAQRRLVHEWEPEFEHEPTF